MKRIALMCALTLPLAGATCEAEQAAVTGGEWQITRIDGLASLAVTPTITLEDGRFHGFGGCNRMMGAYELANGALTLGPVASTKMMCAPEQMQVENALHAALAQVNAVKAQDGQLQLLAGDRVVIDARR